MPIMWPWFMLKRLSTLDISRIPKKRFHLPLPNTLADHEPRSSSTFHLQTQRKTQVVFFLWASRPLSHFQWHPLQPKLDSLRLSRRVGLMWSQDPVNPWKQSPPWTRWKETSPLSRVKPRHLPPSLPLPQAGRHHPNQSSRDASNPYSPPCRERAKPSHIHHRKFEKTQFVILFVWKDMRLFLFVF